MSVGSGDRILVRGLRLWAHVGVLEQERLLGQWFELDFSLAWDLAGAGASDQLELSLDYSLAITALQIGFPAFVVLNTAASFASFRFQNERHAAVSEAIARGGAIGLQCAPFCAQRWEEGWDRPLADWRRELGLIDPVRTQTYSLLHQLPELAGQL